MMPPAEEFWYTTNCFIAAAGCLLGHEKHRTILRHLALGTQNKQKAVQVLNKKI